MKFSIKREELLKLLKFSEKIIESKNLINPILNCINLIINKNQSKCICSNGIISGSYEIPMESLNIEENGKILIKNKILLEIISKVKDDYIHFHKIENTVLSIKTKKFSSEINIIDESSFPNINFEINELPYIEIPNNIINDILRKNTNSTFNDINQVKAISGIYFDTKINKGKLTTLSTDTFKLAYLESAINSNFETNFIVNVSSLNIVNQLFKQNDKNITFYIDEINKKILIKEDNLTIIDRSINEEFPVSIFLNAFNINKKTEIKISKEELITALELGKITVNLEKNPLSIFEIKNNTLEITSSSFEIGSSKNTLDLIEMKGECVKIAFNITFLLSLLKNIESDIINLTIESNIKPMLIVGENINFKELILPSRLNN